MGVFRCPTSSDDLFTTPSKETPQSRASLGKRLSRLTVTSSNTSSSNSIPRPPRPRESRKSGVIKRKLTDADAIKKHQRALAKLLERRRRENKKIRDFSFVYVGNVDPCVTEAELRQMFQHCGHIVRVQKRCSYGVGVSIDRDFPGRKPDDRQYATVDFRNSESIPEALKLHGTLLYGNKLVVTQSAQDLPERAKLPPPKSHQARLDYFSFLHNKRGSRPTEAEFGVATLHGPRTIRQQNVLHGISFPKTVM